MHSAPSLRFIGWWIRTVVATRLVLPALGICLGYWAVGLAMAPGEGLEQKALRFASWDSGWYEDICQRGYHSNGLPVGQDVENNNVGFFPAYPMLCRLGQGLAPGVPAKFILLGISFLCAWAFFILVGVLLARSVPSTRDRRLLFWSVVAFPSSFYLLLGYSESLFALTAVAYLAAAGRRSWAGLWGYGMTATRIFGGPVALVPPAVDLLSRNGEWRKSSQAGLWALAGIVGFFVYCQWEFGHWDLYLQTQRAGWGIRPRPDALLHADRWFLAESARYGPLGNIVRDPDAFSRFFTVIFSWTLVAATLAHWRWRKWLSPDRERLSAIYLLAAWVLTAGPYIALGGGTCRSMVRYLFVPFVCLILWGAPFTRHFSATGRWWFRLGVGTILLGHLVWAFSLFRGFVGHVGRWVA